MQLLEALLKRLRVSDQVLLAAFAEDERLRRVQPAQPAAQHQHQHQGDQPEAARGERDDADC